MRRDGRHAIRCVSSSVLVVVFCAAVLLFVGAAGGAVDFRLDIEGVTPGWVPATGFDHCIVNPPTGAVAHADLLVRRLLDGAAPVLVSRMCAEQAIPHVRLEVIETTASGVRYYAIRMQDVLVTSYSVASEDATNDPIEEIAFNYAMIEWTYIQSDSSDGALAGGSSAWDAFSETASETDPDSDEDGMLDSYEVDEGLKPLIDDADEDSDLDRLTNIDEFWAGTEAGNSNSVFIVTGAGQPGGGGLSLRVTFSSVPGRVYDLYSASTVDLLPAATVPVDTVTASAASTTVDLALPGSQAFVRVKVRSP